MDHRSITRHAVERYRQHYPGASPGDILLDFNQGEDISPDVALTLVGRDPGKTTSEYRLSHERRGMFVVEGGALVTYLRFGQMQQNFVEKHWPQTPTPQPVDLPLVPKKTFQDVRKEILDQKSLARFRCLLSQIRVTAEMPPYPSRKAIRTALLRAELVGPKGNSLIYKDPLTGFFLEVGLSPAFIPEVQRLFPSLEVEALG